MYLDIPFDSCQIVSLFFTVLILNGVTILLNAIKLHNNYFLNDLSSMTAAKIGCDSCQM